MIVEESNNFNVSIVDVNTNDVDFVKDIRSDVGFDNVNNDQTVHSGAGDDTNSGAGDDTNFQEIDCQDLNTKIDSGYDINESISLNLQDSDQLKILDSDQLKILVWNIQGLGSKFDSHDLLKQVSNFDVVIFLETMKLDNFCPDTGSYIFKHFQRKYQNPRARKPSGGIGVLIKSKLYEDKTVTIVKNADFIVWLKINRKNRPDLFLGGVYIPPQDSTSMFSNYTDNNAFHLIQEDVTRFGCIGCVALCGDFNARTGKLKDYAYIPGNDVDSSVILCHHADFPSGNRYSEDTKTNAYGKELIALCKSSNIRIMNGFFNNDKSTGKFTCCTARGTSLIDYLICDSQFMKDLTEFSLSPISVESDHKRLSFVVKVSSLHIPSNIQHARPKHPKPFFKYIFQSEKVSGFHSSLEDMNNLQLLDGMTDCVIFDKNVNAAVSSMYCYLDNVISESFDKRYAKPPSNKFPKNKWFDMECKQLKRICNDFTKQNDLRVDTNRLVYNGLRKKYKALIQKKKRKHQDIIRLELESFHSNKQSDYWKLWDKLKNGNHSQSNELITLQTFESYFENVSCPPESVVSSFDMSFLETMRMSLTNMHTMNVHASSTDLPITCDEVQTQIKFLKSRKAPGFDGICNEFYKCASEQLVPSLTVLFNYVWDKGEFPDKWAEGIIQPLHKKGPKGIADNYRKLTLMSCMGKIFEAILNKRLIFQNEVTLVDDPNQFGFCRGRRTTNNVFI